MLSIVLTIYVIKLCNIKKNIELLLKIKNLFNKIHQLIKIDLINLIIVSFKKINLLVVNPKNV